MDDRSNQTSAQQAGPATFRVIIAGGGTGGHVIPALAIGCELRDAHGAEVCFVGTTRGIEAQLVPAAGFRLELVRSGQLKNVSLKTRLRTAADVPLGVLHCIRLIRALKPQVVVGVGGYASGPAMLAAVLLGVPTLIYEPNAVPGLTNRLLGKRVSSAAVNFAQTSNFFRNAQVTGVPVRPEIFYLPQKPAGAPLRLLVTAGSNGALVFNETMPKIIAELLDAIPGLTVVHQAGQRRLDQTRAEFVASGADPSRWRVEAFLTDMPDEYADADLVLARSGSTVAELCAAGKPGLLVPFAAAADDHQRRNAEVLVQAGAAEMLLQNEVTPQTLLNALKTLLRDSSRRTKMSENARRLSRPGALQTIARMVLTLASTKKRG
jgi:UDP-N-acetylglucosamine--N-acetylmuramyl-(pentapeptide) pyrophosphoryl-undecaprenol N-acetylglucosamine transferase